MQVTRLSEDAATLFYIILAGFVLAYVCMLMCVCVVCSDERVSVYNPGCPVSASPCWDDRCGHSSWLVMPQLSPLHCPHICSRLVVLVIAWLQVDLTWTDTEGQPGVGHADT